MIDVTLVVTSCGRPDLLGTTLRSFTKYNSYPIAQSIVIEDGPAISMKLDLPNLTLLSNETRKGQVYSIDYAYSKVTSPYIFHCEDDWEFYRTGFIEDSLKVLETHKDILQVWIRGSQDTNGHPLDRLPNSDFDLAALDWGGIWQGFSWNPGLRRLCDYQRIGNYLKHKETSDIATEAIINRIYKDLGYRTAVLRNSYVKHTGNGRHIHE